MKQQMEDDWITEFYKKALSSKRAKGQCEMLIGNSVTDLTDNACEDNSQDKQ